VMGVIRGRDTEPCLTVRGFESSSSADARDTLSRERSCDWEASRESESVSARSACQPEHPLHAPSDEVVGRVLSLLELTCLPMIREYELAPGSPSKQSLRLEAPSSVFTTPGDGGVEPFLSSY
jgi:hypothetical protein